MNGKKYLSIFLASIVLFVLFHFTIWNLYTKELFTNTNSSTIGDLGRLSYLSEYFHKREDKITLLKKHQDFTKVEKVDLITIGDSFSNGDVGGENPYYQDFIASKFDFKVLNLQAMTPNFIENILILKNSGLLAKLKPKAIILQSAQRAAISRIARKVNWDITLEKDILDKKLKNRYKNPKPKTKFINNLNYNALLYNILYNFDNNAYFSKVYTEKLNKNLFSKSKNTLLFYYEDLETVKIETKKNIALLNQNLNLLQKKLDELNIKLYFMPSVDKYALYKKYMTNQNYPQSYFFEHLRKEQKEYKIIDTKMILSKLLEKDTKDVFYSDETHWSHIANKAIVDELDF